MRSSVLKTSEFWVRNEKGDEWMELMEEELLDGCDEWLGVEEHSDARMKEGRRVSSLAN